MMTLTQLQDAALREMAEPRTGLGRARKHRNAVLRRYAKAASSLGFTAEQINHHQRDLVLMDHLNAIAGAA